MFRLCLWAEPKAQEPLKAMLYSAILPGGGQVYNHKYLKAGVVLGLQTYFLGSALYNDGKADDYAKKAKLADSAFERQLLEAKRDDYNERERSDYWWMGITAVLSIADAYVDAHLYDFDARKEKVRLIFEDKALLLQIPLP